MRKYEKKYEKNLKKYLLDNKIFIKFTRTTLSTTTLC